MVDKHWGNMVLGSAVLSAMAGVMGERLKGIVIDPGLLELVRRVPGLSAVPWICYRDRTLPTVAKRIRHLEELRRTLREVRPTLALDLEGNQAGALVAWLSGARRRVGPGTCRRHWLYTEQVPMVAGSHRLEGYARVPDWAGIPIPPQLPTLLPTAQDQESWHEFAQSVALAPGEPFACVHPGGGRDEKCWPEDRFAALTLRLRRNGLRSVLVGGRPDLARAGRILVDSAPGTLDATGRLPLGALLAGFSRCSVFVGNDSGPAHLAAAVGAPAVVLFGPTDPGEWAPLGKSVTIVRGDRQPRDGPAANGSGDARRMDSISLDVVSLAALRLARRSGYPEDPSLDLGAASRCCGEPSMGGAR
jgi:ADP-heptose:LPS heptosyltransferase